MKLVAYLTMALALALGTISAATAYFVPISIDAERLDELELSAPAGVYDPNQLSEQELETLETRIENIRDAQAQRREDEAGDRTPLVVREPIEVELSEVPEVETTLTATTQVQDAEALKPIARPGDLLDEAMVTLLRERGVGLVKVSSFNPSIWFGMWQSWLFLAAIGMLTGSALVIRRADAKQHAQEEAQSGQTLTDPVTIVQGMETIVRELAAELPRMDDAHARNHAIVERLGKIQRDDVPAFAEARPLLITRYGLGGFAEIMDVFAAAERQINRAWSAAADGVEAEALDALDRARAILPALEERVARRG